jgi:hypothetical protein
VRRGLMTWMLESEIELVSGFMIALYGWFKFPKTRQLMGGPLMRHFSRSADSFLFANTRMDGV